MIEFVRLVSMILQVSRKYTFNLVRLKVNYTLRKLYHDLC